MPLITSSAVEVLPKPEVRGCCVVVVMAVDPFWKCLHDHDKSKKMYDECL
jgi:hypothetical protein